MSRPGALRAGELLLQTLWVGALWTVGYIVAPALFANLPDRTQAGQMAGELFTLVTWLGLACGGILLVADEVITAFGRLGEWFGSTRFGIRPDLISFAKGVTSGYLPLGGSLVSDRVADVVIAEGGEFAHGYTYSGHPASCAVALANLRIMQSENLVERVRDHTAPYFNERWASLAAHPVLHAGGGVEEQQKDGGEDREDERVDNDRVVVFGG